MVKEHHLPERSPMNISIESRLLGVAITVFVLILTMRSELLQKNIIMLQLTLSIPFLLISMITNAKIVDSDSLKYYYLPNRITNSVGIALIINSLGLLIANYLSKHVGIYFFIISILMLSVLLCLDFNKRKFYNEALMITLIILFGLVPAVL